MSAQKSIETLYEQLQNQEITWLTFVQESEYSEEFTQWCEETGLLASEDTAFLFLEKKDLDSTSMMTNQPEPLQIFLT